MPGKSFFLVLKKGCLECKAGRLFQLFSPGSYPEKSLSRRENPKRRKKRKRFPEVVLILLSGYFEVLYSKYNSAVWPKRG